MNNRSDVEPGWVGEEYSCEWLTEIGLRGVADVQSVDVKASPVSPSCGFRASQQPHSAAPIVQPRRLFNRLSRQNRLARNGWPRLPAKGFCD